MIPFTQYKLPRGERDEVGIERPANIEALAHRVIEAGGKFEAEVLTTGHVSITAVATVDGEPQDIAIKVCTNGPAVVDAVDYVVKSAAIVLGLEPSDEVTPS